MPKPLQFTRTIGPDEAQVTIIEYKPTPEELAGEYTEPLRLGLSPRDSCGDGTEEYLHIEPLVLWRQFPVLYYVDSTVPQILRPALHDSFEEFNYHSGFEFYKETSNQNSAKVVVYLAPIDVPGQTLARAQWNYTISTKTITKATITFDSSENWSALNQQSCGATGNIYDFCHVGTHEVGHISGLSHAPTDRLQTMYATTSPGKTLGRTLGAGDKKGFKLAYKIVTPPEPEENRPPIAKSFEVTTEHDKTVLIALQGSDPDNDPIAYHIVRNPNNGTLTMMSFDKRNWQYTPNIDQFPATDSFDYKVVDDKGLESNIATVTIRVKPVEPEPPSPEPEPTPHEHNFTDAELIQIKVLTLMYENMKKSGIESAIIKAREELQNYITDRLVEKHS